MIISTTVFQVKRLSNLSLVKSFNKENLGINITWNALTSYDFA